MLNSPRLDPNRLIDAIPTILLWTWGSLLVGMLMIFIMTIILEQSTGFHIHFIETLTGMEQTHTRVRGGTGMRSAARNTLRSGRGRRVLRGVVFGGEQKGIDDQH